MVSMTQMLQVSALEEHGWVPIGRRDFTHDTPIGGPTLMQNTKLDVILVFADATVVPMIPYDPKGSRDFTGWIKRAEQLVAEIFEPDE